MIAIEDIKEGEFLAQIPHEVTIYPEKAEKNSEIVRHLNENNVLAKNPDCDKPEIPLTISMM